MNICPNYVSTFVNRIDSISGALTKRKGEKKCKASRMKLSSYDIRLENIKSIN